MSAPTANQPTNQPLPDYYDDLGLSLLAARDLLITGAANRRSGAHTAVVANIGPYGAPSQRVMILRECDWQGRRLRFHTDARADKVAQIQNAPQLSVLIYDDTAKLQLRITGTAHISAGGAADAAWHESTPFARRCYMAQAAPGSISEGPTSGLPDWIEGAQPTEEQLVPVQANFAMLHCQFDRIEWLFLANKGHRRAVFSWDDAAQDWTSNWLVP